jgi:hypothetical protein
MKQAWEDLGTDFAGHEKVVIGDVDCTQHQSVCQTHGVRGYPTIKFFKVSQQRRVLYRAPAPPASLGFPPWNSARQPGLFTDAITNAIPNACRPGTRRAKSTRAGAPRTRCPSTSRTRSAKKC